MLEYSDLSSITRWYVLMPLLFLTAVSELPLLNVAVWLLSLSLVIHSDVILCSSEAIVQQVMGIYLD